MAERAETEAARQAPSADPGLTVAEQEQLLAALEAALDGDFRTRLRIRRSGLAGDLGKAFNDLMRRNVAVTDELDRVRRRVGRDGRMQERASIGRVQGGWAEQIDALNHLVDHLVTPVAEVSRVLSAVADGDLSQRLSLENGDHRLKGEFLRIGRNVNAMVDQLSAFADEVTRVAREVGTEGKLGGQARVRGASGTWADLTDSVNSMARNLTDQVRNIAEVTTAVAQGDLSRKITVDARGEILELKTTVNTMVDQLSAFADEVTRVAGEVGTEGKLGGQARVKGVSGTWKDLTDNVNGMARNLTDQVRNIATVATAVAHGDLSQRITVDAQGEILELKTTLNTMVDQLSAFGDEVTRVAREVGTEGKLGGQARVTGVSGTWKDLTAHVNGMARNLTDQVRNIADVTTAVAHGDLTRRITVDARGEILELKDTINRMVGQLSAFADEVTRVAREVGTEGKLGGQARVVGVSGTWEDLTDSVNSMARNLTDQVRDIAGVTTAVAQGDLSRKITVDARGEILELKTTVNTMVDQLSAFADEVTRVAGEVGTEGKLGGQARVKGVSGTWKDLTDNVNGMARNLTDQVRNIATVATAVAHGDLSQRITVDAQGEILELKTTLNTMVDQLSAFGDEVTRVAREVGTEGKLGGQANVTGVSGTWKDLTDNVNQLAANLTTQVRAIADVSTAVTRGDLSQRIDVEARGEVAELKDTINQMIGNLFETTEENNAQDWLKTNVARISTMLQGQRDVGTVATKVMSHVTPLIDAHSGAFFCPQRDEDLPTEEVELCLTASYAYTQRRQVSNRFRLGEGLVGQAALERIPILVTEAPADYVVQSGLGQALPVNVLVLPILFEDELLGVLEFASLRPFSDSSRQLLDQLAETLGIVLNTIEATMRTEELLEQSQGLTQELQAQSEELQAQQEELQQTNEELEEKAELLETQKRAIELTNAEIERARTEVERRAEQLALSSRYKSEFLANMSHELRTPLNSMLILSRLLADDGEGVGDEQREFAETIHRSGNDLLELINDILDLSKIEAGRMDVDPERVPVADIVGPLEQSMAQVAADKGLTLEVDLGAAPDELYTDVRRLQQILKNLVSNAIKFTDEGGVRVEVTSELDHDPVPAGLGGGDFVAFRVADTGIGIDDEQRLVVFEAFQQGDGSRSRRHGGTGLGLSISRELASLLGGVITLESTPGVGSTFSLYVPVTYTPAQRTESPASELSESAQRLTPIAVDDPQPSAPSSPPERVAARVPERASVSERKTTGGAVIDDRDELRPGDPCLLAMLHDEADAERVVRLAHRGGHRVVVALDRTAGFALATGFRPSGILLDGGSASESLATLTYLKRRRETRHVPVCVVGATSVQRPVLAAGAAFTTGAEPDDATLELAVARVMSLGLDAARRVLVVEDDPTARLAVAELLRRAEAIEVVEAEDADSARTALDAGDVDLVVLDLGLGEGTGLSLLEELRRSEELAGLPVVIHTGKELTRDEESELRRLAETIVVKTVGSPARLLDETLLHLHRAPSGLPVDQQQQLEDLYAADEALRDKRVLVVDDDERNVFALRRALESQGMVVDAAEHGRQALERAAGAARPYDLVLMDIMMPEMDGHEATRRLRTDERYAEVPIITLTAKAMREDRAESLAAGASDFITKPVDMDQLLSLLRVWLYR
ncbi:HAMP domain-containing protein [Egicoccus halophilus]|uniref:Circadian input-output histidine kinase CikA n=1 Tax=Egicoccus halophilus TaxID=1670830 RepID=A0A8J3ADB5_9ACTN|nr:HAMP domain-containing protein [Egicoccus halophilus]GGI04537.1 histidine kinase [Egicoccus halophilus]